VGKKGNVNPEIFRNDLSNDYALLKGNISKKEADERIDDILGLISGYLEDGNDVKLHGFFNFHVRKRQEKAGKNPVTGEDMTIPATRTVVAKMTAPMKRRIQGK
jgi:nucleoid DNA-binding protein